MSHGTDITKEGFLIELDQFIKVCDDDLERIEPEIKRAQARVKEFKEDRLRVIHEAVARLLPDLTPGTIRTIEAQLPAAGVNSNLLQREMAEKERSIRGQYRDIEQESRSELVQRRDMAYSHVRTTEAELVSAREALKPLQDIPDLERLVEAGYGTPAYSLDRSPLKFFSSQWWGDWRAADKIVEDLKLRDWQAVRLAYEAQANAVSTIDYSLRGHEVDRSRYQSAINRIDERDSKIEKIKDVLLERYQTKLRSWIDTRGSSLAGIVPELSRLDIDLRRLDEEIVNLEETRGRIVRERTQLIHLKARMRSSSKRVVPARFATAISSVPRTGTRAMSGGSGFGSGGGVTRIHVNQTVHHHHDGFLDGVVYQQMMEHYNDPPPSVPAPSSGGSYRDSSSRSGYSDGRSSSSYDSSHHHGSSGYGQSTSRHDSRGWS